MVADVCHSACRNFYMQPLESLASASAKKLGLASVGPAEFMPAAVTPVPLTVPPSLRRLLNGIIAIDADGCVAVTSSIDDALQRTADARLTVTLEDVQEYFSSQLLSQPPGRGDPDIAALVSTTDAFSARGFLRPI
jgi:hypothetical protein